MTDPNPLTARDRALIEKSEQALRQGTQLLNWWRDLSSQGSLKRFPLMPSESPDLIMEGFFDQTLIDGKVTPAMGVLQTIRFNLNRADGPYTNLKDFVNRRLLSAAHWQNPDGLPGGFGYSVLLHKTKDHGVYGRFPSPDPQNFDFDQLETSYDWVMLQVDLYDFVRSFPPLRRFVKLLAGIIREAAYLVANEDFTHNLFPAIPPKKVQTDLGYAFVPATVYPNFFGFGPGRFGAAVKLFRFGLVTDNVFSVDMAFLLAPRSEKVLYFWGFDPVYSTVDLLDALTFGRRNIKQRAHDKLDSVMLRQHGQVHENFILGLRKTIEAQNWVTSKTADDRTK
ncbi:MAG TPA: hypothetical protein VE398_23090 [Acidobacteriota bacterium]|nr:hypothetical protein [Acidobacteriota bacterium]